ncbi:hypothetical protein BGX23_009014 [Mortierella sp. AD031]|nr:hypothetical protein BGX23_009014 [Mortierella sp. AD031]
MHPFLLGYVERSVHLEVLELTRFKFTPTDWHRVIANKTKLRKLVILQQCVFEGFDDNEDGETGKGKDSKASQDKGKGKSKAQDQSMAMEIDQAESGSQASSSTNNNNATSNNDNGAAGGTSNRTRKRRAEEMEEEMESALDIGKLPIEHLVLADNRLLFPIQRRILEACPHLQQLEICYSQRADGEQVATQVRESCKEIRPLTLRSTRQPWTPPMIDGMPQSVNDLILHTGQLDLKMAAAIRDRKDALTRLVLDFGRGTKGKRRLACVRSILEENTELREFSYHNHAEDKVFKDIMFKRPWNLPNLPNLRKLQIHGASPRAKYGGLPQTSVPEDWRQEYGGRKAVCCSARSFEDVHKLGPQKKSPLFDVALLDHVQNLDSLSEVVVSEAIYRKRLRTA